MADIKVNTESMNSMINRIETNIENLQTTLKNMKKSVDELNNTWEGPNQTTFEEEFKKHYNEMKAVNKSLKVYVSSLKAAKKKYSNCEKEVIQIVKKL